MESAAPKQKPLSHIILICCVLLLVIVVGIYMVKSTTTTPTKKVVTQACTHDEAICLFLKKIADKKTYYNGPLTATISISTTKNATPTGQVMLQTDTQNNVYVTSSESGKIQGELLLVDMTLYKKTKGVWHVQNDTSAEAFMEFRQKALSETNIPTKGTTYTLLGKQPCGQQTCYAYQFVNPQVNNTKEIIFFDTSNHILQKVVSESTNGTITETVFSYTDVQITPPSGI